LTTTDPSLHDGLSRLLALADPVEINRTAGASGVLPTLLLFCSGVSSAAEEAGVAALRRRLVRLARPARTRSLPILQPTGSRPSQRLLLQGEGVENRKCDDLNEC
jgi:hypothetical protein